MIEVGLALNGGYAVSASMLPFCDPSRTLLTSFDYLIDFIASEKIGPFIRAVRRCGDPTYLFLR